MTNVKKNLCSVEWSVCWMQYFDNFCETIELNECSELFIKHVYDYPVIF